MSACAQLGLIRLEGVSIRMVNQAYYVLKPVIPRALQIYFRRRIANYKLKRHQDIWPIDPKSGNPPAGWRGWPDNKKFALILSHDVDTQKGHDCVLKLIEIEKRLGFKSAYNFVPERYDVARALIKKVKKEGFGVNVHGLKHDGKLFQSKKIFKQRALQINKYINDWEVEGFTAPSMICNLSWMHELNIKHSTCTFDTDPFEPEPNPSKTIFPFFVTNDKNGGSFVELPYTLAQDHLLFIILKEKDNSIWKKKLMWLAEKGGMALLNTHSDYMRFPGNGLESEEYPVKFYEKFLDHIKTEYEGQYWHALPSEMADFWQSTYGLGTEAQSEATIHNFFTSKSSMYAYDVKPRVKASMKKQELSKPGCYSDVRPTIKPDRERVPSIPILHKIPDTAKSPPP